LSERPGDVIACQERRDPIDSNVRFLSELLGRADDDAGVVHRTVRQRRASTANAR
jgi:hypothetical protein